MAFHWVSARNGREAEEALNAALAAHRVVCVERHFCAMPPEPGWAVCIEYATGAATKLERASGKSKDYREVLDPETFRLFAALREWRKEEALKDGVPVYSIMSNEQLAEIAGRR